MKDKFTLYHIWLLPLFQGSVSRLQHENFLIWRGVVNSTSNKVNMWSCEVSLWNETMQPSNQGCMPEGSYNQFTSKSIRGIPQFWGIQNLCFPSLPPTNLLRHLRRQVSVCWSLLSIGHFTFLPFLSAPQTLNKGISVLGAVVPLDTSFLLTFPCPPGLRAEASCLLSWHPASQFSQYTLS